jgi:hypothetical protein
MLLLSAALLVAGGKLLALPFFAYCSGGVLFSVFLTYSLVMCALAMFCAAILPSVRVANMAGFVLFVLGLASQVPLVLEDATAYSIYDPTQNSQATVAMAMAFPPMAFAKTVADISFQTSPTTVWDRALRKEVVQPPEGYSWQNLRHGGSYSTEMHGGSCKTSYVLPAASAAGKDVDGAGVGELFSIVTDMSDLTNATTIVNCTGQYHVPKTHEALDAMGVTALLLWFVGWYCAHVTSGGHTAVKPIYFCLLPSFWRGHDSTPPSERKPSDQAAAGTAAGTSSTGLHPDVAAADEAAWRKLPAVGGGLLVKGLRKEFNGENPMEALLLPMVPMEAMRGRCSAFLRQLHRTLCFVGLPSVNRPERHSLSRSLLQLALFFCAVLAVLLVIAGTEVKEHWLLWRIGIGEGKRDHLMMLPPPHTIRFHEQMRLASRLNSAETHCRTPSLTPSLTLSLIPLFHRSQRCR